MTAIRLPRGVVGGARDATASARHWQVWTLARPLRGYLFAVTAVALAAMVAAPVGTTWRVSDVPVFVGLLACGILTIEATHGTREAQGTVVRDLQTIWYLAIAIKLPPAYALLAPIPMTAYKLWRVQRGLVYRRVFSNATISLAYGAASALFRLVPRGIAGPAPGSGTHVVTWTLVVVGCGAVAWLVNNCLLFAAIRLDDPKARLRDLFANREAATSDLIELSLGVSLALVVSINPVLMVLALPSAVLYRRFLLHSQLVAQVRIDEATGLLNSPAWQREAEVEFVRAQRTGVPLAMAMIDIDHFRAVTDTVGRPASDRVLHGIAATLREDLRGYDLIGRYGGDEFAILFPQTTGDAARRISERLRDKIAGDPVVIEDGSHDGYIFRLTVSVGVAAADTLARPFGDVVSAAGEALTHAKSAGGNRVGVAVAGPSGARLS
jgi:diguanylate cyclase (GGDEF)-like protein